MKKPLVSDARPGIDLHVHSTASDGTLKPSEILTMAASLRLKAIAITDHDTLAGSVAALTAGIPPELHFLTGIEISAAAPAGFPIAGSVHILGYGIDPGNPRLAALIERLTTARQNRNPQIIERLNRLGMDLSMAEVAAFAGDGAPGRPHIAQLMMAKGMVGSVDDAFDRYLGKDGAAYVDKYRSPMDETIGAINQAGGIAVLAHPVLVGLSAAELFERFLATLTAMGLAGIEAIYPDHSPAAAAEYHRLARKYDLLITGGSDFHGDLIPDIRMGSGRGDLHVPFSLYEALAVRLGGRS